jgi:hypothetical protein
VHSDRQLAYRIFANLMANAIKYTCRGKILLGCRLLCKPAEPRQIVRAIRRLAAKNHRDSRSEG